MIYALIKFEPVFGLLSHWSNEWFARRFRLFINLARRNESNASVSLAVKIVRLGRSCRCRFSLQRLGRHYLVSESAAEISTCRIAGVRVSLGSLCLAVFGFLVSDDERKKRCWWNESYCEWTAPRLRLVKRQLTHYSKVKWRKRATFQQSRAATHHSPHYKINLARRKWYIYLTRLAVFVIAYYTRSRIRSPRSGPATSHLTQLVIHNCSSQKGERFTLGFLYEYTLSMPSSSKPNLITPSSHLSL